MAQFIYVVAGNVEVVSDYQLSRGSIRTFNDVILYVLCKQYLMVIAANVDSSIFLHGLDFEGR